VAASNDTLVYPPRNLGIKFSSICEGDGMCNLAAGENCAVDPTDCGSCGRTCSGSISYGGESYGLIQIGRQCWLNKNLNIGTAEHEAFRANTPNYVYVSVCGDGVCAWVLSR